MPVVGVITDAAQNPQSTECSYWEWDYNNAGVAPATSTHSFLHTFREGMNDFLGTWSSAPNGAVRVRGVRWRLALIPPVCQF